MFIKDPSPLSKIYKCNNRIAKYLQKQGLPLLSQEGGIFYFSKTEELEKALLKLPFYLKWFK